MTDSPTVMIPAVDSPLAGVQLIEASAGTGKTWTLSALFARLIVEKGLSVDQVLAITFTKAAAAELRDRIRGRLLALSVFLEDDTSDDERATADIVCQHIASKLTNDAAKELAKSRLAYALADFDQATITTINGFCQGVLVEQALASGMPLDSELLTDTTPLIHEIIQDYCRQHWRQADPLLVAYFLQHPDFALDKLYSFVSSILAQGQAIIEKPDFYISAGLAPKTQKLFKQAQAIWQQGQQDIRQLFIHNRHLLNGNSFRESSIDNWFNELNLAFAGSALNVLNNAEVSKVLTNLSRSNLDEKRVKKSITENVYFPAHPFFELAEELVQCAEACQEQLQRQGLAFKFHLLEHTRSTLVQRLYDQQAQSFDMQIKGLANALTRLDTGVELAKTLRDRFPAALVDEFQDTDNYQYQILQHVYLHDDATAKKCALFLVGDPKQAIYRFRGADVYTYLQAYNDVKEQDRHQLAANQRSVSPLISALNCFFTACGDDAFKQEKIKYHQVSAGERAHLQLIDLRESTQANVQALRLLYWPTDKTTKDTGRQWAVQTVVNEIVYLLTGAAQEQVLLGEKAIEGKDIVILVRSHFEAEACRSALAKVGIKAAMQSRNKVFDTHEADDMGRILAAFADPHNEGKVRAALTSRLCGATVQDLLAWQADAKAWTTHLIHFQDYQQRWKQRGFMSAWRYFLQQEGAIARLASLPQGERAMTNFLHLADLLHEEYRQRPGMRQLDEWFSQQRLAPQESENAELRLESDENLIKIMTIHQSKGLEFPIVFVPMLWSPPDPKRGTPFYHQHGHGVFDLRPNLPPEIEQLVIDEVLSEDLRLGYVALTRAAQRCYLLWCPLDSKSNVSQSALGHWLPDGVISLNALAASSPNNIGVYAVEPENLQLFHFYQQQTPTLTVLTPPRLPWGYRLTSFSSLHHGAKALQRHDEVLDIKDDEGKVLFLDEETDVVSARFNFAGKKVLATNVGNCLHQIFEYADFTKPVSEWHENIDKQLNAYGILTSWRGDVITWLSEVMQAPLSPTLTLQQLSFEHTLRELDFHLPLAKFQPVQLIDCLRQHGLSVPELPPQTITGFMKGSIDLVFQHNGQYFIADYKSNHLGHQLSDYQQQQLSEAMAHSGYTLQAALYALALHKWLASRLQSYDFEKHFGGIYYLFLRGMNANGQEGIHFWRPSLDLLTKLNALMGETP
ncbi:MAG: exodeoxyribonuclease V subunit beta [Agitococcus sp.]|nr:exodeoxyribonuclease V subunit beta [Agitococcus sp.]